MTKTLKAVYTNARELIESGWTKGVMYEPEFTAFCSQGAIAFSIWGSKAFKNPQHMSPFIAREEQHENYELYQKALHVLEDIVEDDIPTWNDSGLTSKADVLAAFQKAQEEV